MTWETGTGPWYLTRYGLEEGAARMARHGYTHMDYNLADTEDAPYTDSDEEAAARLTAVRKTLAAQGITVSQVHGPWRWPIRDATPEERAERMEKMIRCAHMAQCLGAPYMVIHPMLPYGWLEEPDPDTFWQINLDHFTRLCRAVRPTGVTVCLENMPFVAAPLTHVDGVVRMVREVDAPNLRVCLDTGHAVSAGMSPGDAVRRIGGDLLACLHVHDSERGRDCHWLPYFGTADWADFNAALHEANYRGVLSLETSPSDKLPDDIREHFEIGMAMMAKKLAE